MVSETGLRFTFQFAMILGRVSEKDRTLGHPVSVAELLVLEQTIQWCQRTRHLNNYSGKMNLNINLMSYLKMQLMVDLNAKDKTTVKILGKI